ncbi:hypothetical protein [Vibrio hippocampi]|uniref:Uncharacterized protein n=1 Tax=Vibrio hippocampi TaxID=654686 RepID=A0ABM8ZM08_9VIBR|nr:hypothetical protein [Vibrio hippocampi]CAH0528980.1 hypothetical protein VHP8226_02990 [Vibrio hippocampi]
MNYDFGAAYLGQMLAKQMFNELDNRKPQPKKKSFVQRMIKKMK